MIRISYQERFVQELLTIPCVSKIPKANLLTDFIYFIIVLIIFFVCWLPLFLFSSTYLTFHLVSDARIRTNDLMVASLPLTTGPMLFAILNRFIITKCY